MEAIALKYMRKADLERVYKLKVYTSWDKVPKNLVSKSKAKEEGLGIFSNPCAIKSSSATKSAYFLYQRIESKEL